jgi:hypothetical protein
LLWVDPNACRTASRGGRTESRSSQPQCSRRRVSRWRRAAGGPIGLLERRCAHRVVRRSGVGRSGSGSGRRPLVVCRARIRPARLACPSRLASGGFARVAGCLPATTPTQPRRRSGVLVWARGALALSVLLTALAVIAGARHASHLVAPALGAPPHAQARLLDFAPHTHRSLPPVVALIACCSRPSCFARRSAGCSSGIHPLRGPEPTRRRTPA